MTVMGWQVSSDARLTLALFAALVALQCLDVLTGWLAAIVTRSVSSRVSWSGVSRKALTLCVLLALAIVNALAPAPLSSLPLVLPALAGYIGSELYSIFENAARAGVLHPSLAAFLARRPQEAKPDAVR